MNTYLIAYRKDASGPAWLLSEVDGVEETRERDIIRCPLSRTSMEALVYFEAPDLDQARSVLSWVKDGTPKIVRTKMDRKYVHPWEEMQRKLPERHRAPT